METQLINGLRAAGVHKKQRLLLAVSGGADSMALLHAAANCMESECLTLAHLNHHLRGEESDADAEFVRQQSQLRGIKVVTGEAAVSRLARESGLTIEETARQQRYRFLLETATELEIPWVVTAHHQRDQAETVMHHILRGTSLRGLAGIPVTRKLSETTSLVRPLLTVTPDRIRTYLADECVPFREDTSNLDAKFTRNRIRHELLPLLAGEYNEQSEQHLISLARQAREVVQCLDSIAEATLHQTLIERQPDSCRLDFSVLRETPIVILRQLLTLLWNQQQWPRGKMSFGHWHQLASGIQMGCDFGQDLPAGLRAECRGELVHIFVRQPVPCRIPDDH